MCYNCGKYGHISRYFKEVKNKYCTYFKNMDTTLKSVTAKISMDENSRTVTGKAAKKCCL